MMPEREAHLRPSDLRALIVLRRRLRDEVVGLPKAWLREVLRAMEEARQRRHRGRAVTWTPPEMSPSEFIRAIKWRVEVATLAEAAAGARALERGQRITARARRVTPRRRP